MGAADASGSAWARQPRALKLAPVADDEASVRIFLRILLVLLGLALLPAGLAGVASQYLGEPGRAKVRMDLRLKLDGHFNAQQVPPADRKMIVGLFDGVWAPFSTLAAPPLWGGLLGGSFASFGVAVFALRGGGGRARPRARDSEKDKDKKEDADGEVAESAAEASGPKREKKELRRIMKLPWHEARRDKAKEREAELLAQERDGKAVTGDAVVRGPEGTS